ncbi:PepSY-associated TM helix domain-containing protein [Bradyrhizobium sp.]|uniref:PepSY-associated TM helix domain-containing protein n=1 Tax=Bradyrhizobium sp. TaxID=376 RepID=UPI0039E6FB46
MSRLAFRRWFWLHKWSSLVCTGFLLLICVTGLPLVFSDEIGDWLETGPAYASVPDGTPAVSLDSVVATARAMYPEQVVGNIFIDDDEPRIMVAMAPSWAAFAADRSTSHWIKFDAHTGKVLAESQTFSGDGGRFIAIMLSLHRDLFAGLTGELFMGAMALLFVIAIVSGVVAYGPFMRKLDFGTVRTGRSRRLKWLDLHNLTGIVLLAWMTVVGVTGVINELSTPLFGLWRLTDVQAMLLPFRNKPTPQQNELSSPQGALDAVRAAMPEMIANSVVFPGSPFGSPYHYVVWTKGRQPLTSRLFSPALVDARSGKLTAVVEMPWYLRALEVSRPLHFGDYGGLPLKILWALLDLVTIVVLASGLYLWLSRKASWNEAEQELAVSNAAAPLPEAAE